ncbi:unnamed protein product [Effrenium voratum]|nr:unnamed protein product [Effrenium voratum]
MTTEKELFEKFACHCRATTASLQGELDAAEKAIPELDSEILELESSGESLGKELERETRDNSEAVSGEKNVRQLRARQSQESELRLKELAATLQSLEAAIKAIREGSSLLQVPMMDLQEVLEQRLDSDRKSAVLSFLSAGFGLDGEAESSPASSEVLGTLEAVLSTVQTDYEQAKAADRSAARDFGGLLRSRLSERRSLQQSLLKKSQRLGGLKLRLVELRKDAQEKKSQRDENRQMLAELQQQCQEKAAEWDQHEAARHEELSAIADTIGLLEESRLARKAPVSLLQLQDVKDDARSYAMDKLTAIKSTSAQFVLLALRGQKLGLEEVAQMITRLLTNLRSEAQSEAEKKQYCQARYSSSASKKRTLQNKEQEAAAAMGEARESLKLIQDDLQQIKQGIQDLDASVAEAKGLRKAERLTLANEEADALETEEILQKAKTRLSRVYRGDGASFLDQVASRLRKLPSAEFGASLAEPTANRVLSLLDRLISDVRHQRQSATAEESKAQKEHDSFLQDSARKRSTEMNAMVAKRSVEASAKAELQNFKELRATADQELQANEDYKLALDTDCAWLLQNWEERSSARLREVQALESARSTLVDEAG